MTKQLAGDLVPQQAGASPGATGGLLSRKWVLTALLLLASVAGADCGCALKNLPAERAAQPLAYDAVFGIFTPHSREYWQARLKAHPEGLEAARAWSGLGHDDKAAALLADRDDPPLAAFRARCLARLGRWREAADLLQAALDHTPDKDRPPAWAWQQLACVNGPAMVSRTIAGWHGGLLGQQLDHALGADFRQRATIPLADPKDRAFFEAGLWAKLSLPPLPFDGLPGVLELLPRGGPDPYYALGELLAACGYRRLAWHAYQRAWDLEHPMDKDLVADQNLESQPLDEPERMELTASRHYRLRRTVVNWQEACTTWERRTLAAGGDPDDPQALAAFLKEHPRP
jgi:tetratricopeptide (TPR) repeat protein